MSKLYKLTSSLNRYALCVINLSLVNFLKIAYFHFFGDGRIIRLNTKNFNEIYYRSNGDIGVLAHFFTAQTGFVFKSPYEMKTIFDLGANIGIETIRMKKMFPDSKIISVELEKENFKLLQKNTKALKNVETINKAIWNSVRQVGVTQKNSWDNQTFSATHNYSKRKIETVTIDGLMKDYNISNINLLKIDIEGAEQIIFDKSCDNWIANVDIIMMECPDEGAPFTTQKIFEAFGRNALTMNTYVNGENIIFCKKGIDVIPKSVDLY